MGNRTLDSEKRIHFRFWLGRTESDKHEPHHELGRARAGRRRARQGHPSRAYAMCSCRLVVSLFSWSGLLIAGVLCCIVRTDFEVVSKMAVMLFQTEKQSKKRLARTACAFMHAIVLYTRPVRALVLVLMWWCSCSGVRLGPASDGSDGARDRQDPHGRGKGIRTTGLCIASPLYILAFTERIICMLTHRLSCRSITSRCVSRAWICQRSTPKC